MGRARLQFGFLCDFYDRKTRIGEFYYGVRSLMLTGRVLKTQEYLRSIYVEESAVDGILYLNTSLAEYQRHRQDPALDSGQCVAAFQAGPYVYMWPAQVDDAFLKDFLYFAFKLDVRPGDINEYVNVDVWSRHD